MPVKFEFHIPTVIAILLLIAVVLVASWVWSPAFLVGYIAGLLCGLTVAVRDVRK